MCSLGKAFRGSGRWSKFVFCGLLLGCGAPAQSDSAAELASAPSPSAQRLPNDEEAVRAATPLSLRDALAISNLSGFEPPVDSTRSETTPIAFSFTAPATAERTIDATLVALKEQLAAAEWRSLSDFKPDRSEFGATLYYERQGLMMLVAVGKSQGVQGDDVNAVLMLVGNVDARSLPLPEGALREIAEPGSAIYSTALKPLDLHAFYKKVMPAQGWIEFRRPDIPGIETPMEQKVLEQGFVQRGIKLDIHYQPAADSTRVISRLSLVKQELPIPLDARSVEFGDDPPYLFCSSRKSLKEVTDFFTEFLEQQGWEKSKPISTEPADLVLAFTAPGRKALWLGISDRQKLVYLQLKLDRPQ